MGINPEKGCSKGKKDRGLFAMFVAFIICWLTSISPISANAQEQAGQDDSGVTKLNKIMEAVEDLDAKETPDDSAGTVVSYHAGDSVFVTGQTADGWYLVRYQDITGYVHADQVAEQTMDIEALNDEFAVEESEGTLVVEEVERHRIKTRRSRIWGVVIVLLVLGIFVTGIASTVRSGEKDD